MFSPRFGISIVASWAQSVGPYAQIPIKLIVDMDTLNSSSWVKFGPLTHQISILIKENYNYT